MFCRLTVVSTCLIMAWFVLTIHAASRAASAAQPKGYTVPVQSLYGGAAWSMKLTIGTPPVEFGVYIDTGSSDLVITKTGCTGCSPVGQTYTPSDSTTSLPVGCGGDVPSAPSSPLMHTSGLVCHACVNNTCTDSVGYTTGTDFQNSTFQVFSDVVTSGEAKSRATMGAIYEMTGRPHLKNNNNNNKAKRHAGMQVTQSTLSALPSSSSSSSSSSPGLQDGVIGLAFTSRSVARQHNFIEDLAFAGVIPRASFSMTLNSQGGFITFGGLGPFIKSPVQYMPVTKQGFWQIDVLSVGLNGTAFPVAAQEYNLTIIDTGTPTLNLPSPAWAAFQTSLRRMCTTGVDLKGVCGVPQAASIFNHSVCVQLSPEQLSAYPDISYDVRGFNDTVVHLSVPAEQYLPANLYSCPQDAKPYPYRGLAVIQEPGWTVLGGPALIHYDVLYDYDRSLVGFALSQS